MSSIIEIHTSWKEILAAYSDMLNNKYDYCHPVKILFWIATGFMRFLLLHNERIRLNCVHYNAANVTFIKLTCSIPKHIAPLTRAVSVHGKGLLGLPSTISTDISGSRSFDHSPCRDDRQLCWHRSASPGATSWLVCPVITCLTMIGATILTMSGI